MEAGAAEGTGCRLGAPTSPPSEIQVSIQGSTLRAQQCLGKPPFRPEEVRLQAVCSGLQPAPWAGGQPHGEESPALLLALWSSDLESPGPRRAERRMDLTIPPLPSTGPDHPTLPQGAAYAP